MAEKVEISSPDKTMYPKPGYTKKDVVEYYTRIAKIAIKPMKDRPVTMHRYPNGIDDKDFYQKEIPDYFPDWIDRKKLDKREGGSTTYVICNKRNTLRYLANQAVLVPHIWLSRIDKIEYPDKLIFDLDPPDKDFKPVIKGAKALKEKFEDFGLKPFVMTTGSKGLHVVAPIKPEMDFDHVRNFAKKIAQDLADDYPDDFTVEQRKNKRKGRLFLDILRNAYAQTSVAPYALRALEIAPIATPLTWDELDRKSINAQTYHLGNIFKRLGKKSDPWHNFNRHARSI